MTHITLCLIAKNEEELLLDCLKSVEGAVDSIVVVDTGSTDGTAEIAAAAGALVVHHEWRDDFSAARNAALEHARGDWVLLLDADERLAPGAQQVLRAAAEEGGFDCGLLPLHDAERLDRTPAELVAGDGRRNDPMLVGRLYRRTPDLRWEGIVHEQATTWLRNHGALRRVEAAIVHYGTVPSVREERDKAARNLRLLEKRCALEPSNPTVRQYLCRELVRAGDEERALEVIDEAWALLERCGDPRPDSITPASLRGFLRLARDDFDTVLDTLERARGWDGEHPNLDLLKGVVFERQWLAAGDGEIDSALLARAEDSYAACLAYGDRMFTAEPMPGATSWAAATRLGVVRILRGKHADALEAFETALAARPDHVEAQLGRAECWIELHRFADAIRELEPLLATKVPDVWILAAAAALLGGAPEMAAPMVPAARTALATNQLVAPHRFLILRDLEGWAVSYEASPKPDAVTPAPVRLPIELREDVDTVSVVVPAYGRADLLRRVLEGFVQEHSSQAFELILVDDGSETSLEPILAEVGSPDTWKFARHQENRGRAAGINTGLDLAQGDVVIVCDSDVVPEPGYVQEHLAFHREHPSLLATHLGALTWGTDPGLYGRLMGPRSNPHLRGRLGKVDWTTWFTDNWSCKRELLTRDELRFDEAFRVWGFEELELAARLVRRGATNTLTERACGRHLKAATFESHRASFSRGLPNLLYLASRMPGDPRIAQWLAMRWGSEASLRRAEAFLSAIWRRVGDLDDAAPKGLRPDLDAPVQRLAVELSDALFSLGVARGFEDHPDEAERLGVVLPRASEEARVLALAPLCAAVDTVADRVGEPSCDEAVGILGLEGDLLEQFQTARERCLLERAPAVATA